MYVRSIVGSVAIAAILGYVCYGAEVKVESPDGVVYLDDDNAEMNAAIKKAKKTFKFFEKNWRVLESDGYSVKFALPTTDGSVEHIWFTPTKIDGDKITGECANDPANVADLKLGDTRTITRDKVSDWMILAGKKCYGGYTVRVLLKQSPKTTSIEFIDPPTE